MNYINERNKHIAYYTNNYDKRKHCGYIGKANELIHTPTTSHKTDVSGVGKIDVPNGIFIDGYKTKRPFENKINGGRVSLDGTGFIVYQLVNVCNANTNYVPRNTVAIVARYTDFIEYLTSINAIKTVRKNGRFDGYGIQCTSKVLYLTLEQTFPPFDKNHVYHVSPDGRLTW